MDNIDFGAYFEKGMKGEASLDPTIISDSLDLERQTGNNVNLVFTDNTYKNISDQYGEDTAKKAKDIYTATTALNEHDLKTGLFNPIVTTNTPYTKLLYGEQAIGKTPSRKNSGEFIYDGFVAPIRKETEEVIGTSNDHYFDKWEKKPLELGQMDEMGGNFNFFSNKQFVLMTNEDRAKISDSEGKNTKKALDMGILKPKHYYKDPKQKYVWRTLEDGEDHFDRKIRSIWGDESMQSDGYLSEMAQGLNDSAINMMDTIIFGQKAVADSLYTAPAYLITKVIGGKPKDIVGSAYSDYLAWSKSRLTRSSKEDNKGWNYNITNFSKAVLDGIVQIGATRGVGAVGGGIAKLGISLGSKGLYTAGGSAMRTSAMNAISNAANKSAMGFSMGYAASSAYKEAKKSGLDDVSAYTMAGISGAILRGTEKYLGGDWMYKVFGKKKLYGEFGAKVVKELNDASKLSGRSVQEVVENKPFMHKMVDGVSKWFASESKTRYGEIFKGIGSESIQETSEDFLNALAQNSYDYFSNEKMYKNDWNTIMHDLAGSFVIGGLTGGVAGGFSPLQSTTNKNQNTFHYMLESEANGEYESDIEELKTLRDNGLLGSYTLASTSTPDKLELADEKSQNDYMYEVLKKQRDFVHSVATDAKAKFKDLDDNAAGMLQTLNNLIDQKYLSETDAVDFGTMKDTLNKTLQTEAILASTELDNNKNIIAYELAKNNDMTTIDESLDSIEAIKGNLLRINGAEPTEAQKAEFKQSYNEVENLESKAIKDLNNLYKEKEELEFKEARRISDKEASRLESVKEEINEKEKDLSDKLLSRGLGQKHKEALRNINDISDFLSEVDNRLDYYQKRVALNLLKMSPTGQQLGDYGMFSAFKDNKRIDYYIENYDEYVKEMNNKVANNNLLLDNLDELEVVTKEQRDEIISRLETPESTSQDRQNLLDTISGSEKIIRGENMKLDQFNKKLAELEAEENPDEGRIQFLKEEQIADAEAVIQIEQNKIKEAQKQLEEINTIVNEYNSKVDQINRLLVFDPNETMSSEELLTSRFINANNIDKLDQPNFNIIEKTKELQQQEIKENNQNLEDPSYDSGERNFDMAPTIEELIKEVNNNIRDLVVQTNVFNRDVKDANNILTNLYRTKQDLENLLAKSKEAKNQRWKVDYKLKLDYINGAYNKLVKLNEYLNIDSPSELPTNLLISTMTEENIGEIDILYSKLLDDEIRYGKALKERLNEENIAEFYETIGIDDPKKVFHEMFKSDNQYNPENPDNAVEDYYNYVNNLLRGYDAEFYNEYNKVAQGYSDPLSSFEQVLAQKHIFKFLVSGNTILEDYVNTREDWLIEEKGKIRRRGSNTLVARGYAGSGKTTHLFNMTLQLASNFKKGVNFLYSGYTKAQVENLGKSSIINANKTPISLEEFFIKLSEEKVNDNIDYVIFDEFSLFGSFITIDKKAYFLENVFDGIESINIKRRANNKPELKVLFLGDEYQISGNKSGDTYPYLYNTEHKGIITEKTTPISTIYRTGKVDGVEFQQKIRDIIPIYSQYTKYITDAKERGEPVGSTKGLVITLPNGETINFDNGGTEEILISRINNYLLSDFVPSYNQDYGIEYLEESALISRFINNFNEDSVLITSSSDKNRIKNLVPKEYRNNVVSIQEYQGNETDVTYVVVNAENNYEYRNFLSELLVASSRDKNKMHITSSTISINSKQGRPDFFPPIKIKLEDGTEVLSEEVLEHNKRMKNVLNNLTGKEEMEVNSQQVTKEATEESDGKETVEVVPEQEMNQDNVKGILDFSKAIAEGLDNMSQEEKDNLKNNPLKGSDFNFKKC